MEENHQYDDVEQWIRRESELNTSPGWKGRNQTETRPGLTFAMCEKGIGIFAGMERPEPGRNQAGAEIL